MFGALAGLIQDDRKRLGESIDALQQTVKIGKIKRDMKSYLDTYGMDLSSGNIRAHGKTVGNYDWKDALVEGIKQFRSAQSEGRYQESPGQITRDFSGKELTKGLDKVEEFTPIPFWDTVRKAPVSALNPTEAFEFFRNPTRYQRGGAPQGDDGTKTYQQQIADTMRVNPGLSEKDATAVVLGTSTVVPDPVTGRRFLVNKLDGTERELRGAKEGLQSKEEPEAEAPMQQTIWGASEKGTGPISAGKAALSTVSGMVGGPISEETIQARQVLNTASAEFARAVAQSPRFAEGERNWILKELALIPAIFDNPKMFRERAKVLDGYLRRRLVKEEKAGANNDLPVTDRQTALRSANDIKSFLKTLGVPQSERGGKQTAPAKRVKNVLDYKSIKSGETYIDPSGTTRIKP